MSDARRTVFLDRDGTINVKSPEGDYVKSPAEFEFLPGAVDAVRALHDAGWIVVVVTNQRGIARGVMTEDEPAAIREDMLAALADAVLSAVSFCTHDDVECDCRKPKP